MVTTKIYNNKHAIIRIKIHPLASQINHVFWLANKKIRYDEIVKKILVLILTYFLDWIRNDLTYDQEISPKYKVNGQLDSETVDTILECETLLHIFRG